MLIFLILLQNWQYLPTPELAIPTETPTNEANVEIDIHPLTAETKQENALSNSKPKTLMLFALKSLLVSSKCEFHISFILKSASSFTRFVFKVYILSCHFS